MPPLPENLIMTLRRLHRLGLILSCMAVAGCDQGRENPPDVFVRVLNAAPSFGPLGFRREQITQQNQQRNLTYKESTSYTYDQDTYDFFVDDNPPGVFNAIQVARFTKEVRPETVYTFVLTEAAGAIEPVILEQPKPATTSAEAHIVLLHAGEAQPPMDIYLVPAAMAPAVIGPPVASLSFGQSSAPRTIAAGDYVLTATTSGDPTSVLLTSTQFPLAAAASSALVIVDGAEQGIAPFGVILLGQAFGELIDQGTQAGLRVINGATDGAARDVAINDQFTPPLFAAVPFATPTDYKLVAPNNLTVNVTPPGNPGVLELTATITPSTNVKHTLLFSGDAGALTYLIAADDGRRIDAEAHVRFYNVATQFTFLEFYIVEPGITDLTNVFPIVTLGAPGISQTIPFPPGTYDLFLRPSGSTTLAAGPVTFTVDGGGIYGLLSVNGPDTASAGILYLDDFP